MLKKADSSLRLMGQMDISGSARNILMWAILDALSFNMEIARHLPSADIVDAPIEMPGSFSGT